MAWRPARRNAPRLIRLYEQCGQTGDPRYGNRAKAAALAGELAGRIGYHPGPPAASWPGTWPRGRARSTAPTQHRESNAEAVA